MCSIKKRMLALVAVLAIAITLCVPGVSVDAKKKSNAKSVTLFVGEELQLYPIGSTLKSVKSSKKKVVKVSKKSGSAILKAKKAGKSSVTLKTNRGNTVYNVTVKKSPFKATASPMAGGKVLVTVKNNSSTYFSSVYMVVTLCDAAGNPLTDKDASVVYLGGKQTAYTYVSGQDGADLSKTKVAVKKWNRYTDYKTKNYAKNVNLKVLEDTTTYSRLMLKMNASTNYSGKGTIYIAQDIFCYDVNGQLIGVISQTGSLYDTKHVYTSYGDLVPAETASYEVKSKRVTLQYR